MRISWGYKITAVYLLFVAGIVTLVVKASAQHFDLVTEDYYDQELKFQNVIDEQKAVAGLSEPPHYAVTPGSLLVALPAEFEGKTWKGELYLYRPSNAALDLRQPVTGSGRAYAWTLPRPLSGAYRLKFTWELNGKKFYHEQALQF